MPYVKPNTTSNDDGLFSWMGTLKGENLKKIQYELDRKYPYGM